MQQLGQVLLVDDDSIRNFLSARAAADGREALGLVKKGAFSAAPILRS